MHSTIGDIQKRLQDYEATLILQNLGQVVIFNRAYLIITENFLRAREQKLFIDQNQMDSVFQTFVERYFHAVEQHQHKASKLCRAWQQLFTDSDLQRNPLKALILGANAHVNYDLALALENSKATLSFEHDYTKFMRVIAAPTGAIIDTLHAQLPATSTAPATYIYRQAIIIVFSCWRMRVWMVFRALHSGRIGEKHIEKQSYDFAKKITKYAPLGLFFTL